MPHPLKNALEIEIDPGQRMEELSVGQQQMVEIAKGADGKCKGDHHGMSRRQH